MIRGLLTIGFVLFLAAAAVWACRHYGFHLPETRQADVTPNTPAPQQDAPAPPAIPRLQPAPESVPVAPIPAPQPPAQQPQPEPPPTTTPPPERIPDPPTPRVGKRTHLVSPGETLWEISLKYFNSPAYVEQIADANHLDAPNRLRPGTVLVLPEIPGLRNESERAVPGTPETEQVNAPQRAAPMPPTLSRSVTVE